MSKYTTEVRFICEQYAGMTESSGYASIPEVIEKARTKVFDFAFPMFDEAYRSVLETKILKHFYTREIGEETVSLWKLRLDAKLNEIMPYYNKLYESELITFNPLYMTDLHTERNIQRNNNFNSKTDSENTGTRNASDNRTSSGSRGSSVNNVTDDWNVFSDTPQGSLSGVEDETYLTNATHTFGNTEGSESSEETEASENGSSSERTTAASETNTSSKGNDTEAYVDHIFGYAGSNPSENIIKFRSALLNIDAQILEDLNPLFFNLW